MHRISDFHMHSCIRGTACIKYIDFMHWITSKQASVKLWKIPTESKRPERVYFQTTLTRQTIFLPVCSQCGFTFRWLHGCLLEDHGDRAVGYERGVCSVFVVLCHECLDVCASVCSVSLYQYTFLKTNNSTVLTTT